MKNFFEIQRFAEISNSTENVLVSGTAENDSILNWANNVTINPAAGDDSVTLSNTKNLYMYTAGDGADLVYGAGYFTTINIIGATYSKSTVGNDVILTIGDGSITLNGLLPYQSVNISGTLSGANGNEITNFLPSVVVNGTETADSIENDGAGSTIYAFAGNDYVNNSGANSAIYLAEGDDSLYNFAAQVTVYGGDGADSLTGNFKNALVDGGADNDTIKFVGHSASIFAGAGDDYILFQGNSHIAGFSTDETENPNTIIAGTGDDTISNEVPTYDTSTYSRAYYTSVPNLYKYSTGDGNDVIIGFSASDTLQIDGNFSTLSSGEDVIVNVGENSITLKNISGENLNIVSENAPQNTDSGDSQVITTAQTIYTGGNQVISDYNGEKINYHADFTGLGFSDTDFMLNSSTGTLTIQNVRDKVIDVAVNDQTIAYAYLANSGGAIDGSSYAPFEVIIGANDSANEISAGSGGSSLWGGSGGNDTLTGGAGVDEFFFGKADGADKIFNAGSADVVNLYDVTLADILTADISGQVVTANLTSGGSLQINSAESLSATFKLADGSYQYNHSSGEWQFA